MSSHTYRGAFTLSIGLVLASFTAHAESGDKADICQPQSYSMAIRYQQSSEIAALQAQTYQLAQWRLSEKIRVNKNSDQPLAIITDLDETVIDNSALLARDAQHCHDYTAWDTWEDWEQHGNPTLLPGALEFFKWADQQGVTIYYISDRTDKYKASTLNTLKALQLPQVKTEQVLLLGPDKKQRRQQVAETHKIIMLLGDSLTDFSAEFGTSNLKQRHTDTERVRAHFVSWR